MDLSTPELRKKEIHAIHDKYLVKLKALGFPEDTSLRIATFNIEIGQLDPNGKSRFHTKFATEISVYGTVSDFMGIQEPYFSVSSMGAINPEKTDMVFKLKAAALTLEKYDEVVQIATEACNERTKMIKQIEAKNKK